MKAISKTISLLLLLALFAGLAAGCGATSIEDEDAALADAIDDEILDSIEVSEDEIPEAPEAPETEEPSVTGDEDEDPDETGSVELLYIPETAGSNYEIPSPVASGTLVNNNVKATLDYSNTADGYVMVKYTGSNAKVKVIITCPSSDSYTYNIRLDGQYDVFPLSDGNGTYKVTVYENISGTSYSTAYSFSFKVTLKDEFSAFLRSNKYVSFTSTSEVVKKAAELTKNDITVLEAVNSVYSYVIKNIKYDYAFAKTVQSGYVPDVDAVLKAGKGICFDYAAVMTAMLRSQGIPAQLVIGYAGTVYHAWINVYSEETGWMTASIYFNGDEWKLMDPTFASTGKSSASVLAYIGNGENYKEKYIY